MIEDLDQIEMVVKDKEQEVMVREDRIEEVVDLQSVVEVVIDRVIVDQRGDNKVEVYKKTREDHREVVVEAVEIEVIEVIDLEALEEEIEEIMTVEEVDQDVEDVVADEMVVIVTNSKVPQRKRRIR